MANIAKDQKEINVGIAIPILSCTNDPRSFSTILFSSLYEALWVSSIPSFRFLFSSRWTIRNLIDGYNVSRWLAPIAWPIVQQFSVILKLFIVQMLAIQAYILLKICIFTNFRNATFRLVIPSCILQVKLMVKCITCA